MRNGSNADISVLEFKYFYVIGELKDKDIYLSNRLDTELGNLPKDPVIPVTVTCNLSKSAVESKANG